MITKEYPISVPVSFLEKTGISPETCLFFDIETTGLSWRRSHLYLLGAVFYTPEGWLQKQWFCQRPGEEKDLLEIFSSLLEQKKTLIHFNGNTFDIPYLMHKSTFYQMELNWDGTTSLDLYQKLLPFKKLLGLEHMRQKDLERYLGRSREDLFSGGELISLYQEYLKTADERLLSVLLLHNREDVSEMTGLLPLLELSRLFSGSWEGTVEAQVTPDLQLLLKPAVSLSLPLDFTYDASCCQLSAHQGKLTLDIPILQDTLKYFFPDYKNYFYLPLEDRAIHKSVGAYVNKEHREKAKASTCYQKQTGQFLPQFSEEISPSFRWEYRDSCSWFLWDDKMAQDSSWCVRYFNHLLSHIFP